MEIDFIDIFSILFLLGLWLIFNYRLFEWLFPKTTFYDFSMLQYPKGMSSPIMYLQPADNIYLSVIYYAPPNFDAALQEINNMVKYLNEELHNNQNYEFIVFIRTGYYNLAKRISALQSNFPNLRTFWAEKDSTRTFLAGSMRSRGIYSVNAKFLQNELPRILQASDHFLDLVEPIQEGLLIPHSFQIPAAVSKNTFINILSRIHETGDGFAAEIQLLCRMNNFNPGLIKIEYLKREISIFQIGYCYLKSRFVEFLYNSNYWGKSVVQRKIKIE